MVEEVKSEPISTMPLEPIEEIVPVEINIEGARELEDYLNLIEINNNTDSNKLVVLAISGNSNANLPRCLRVMASKSKEDYYFHKTNPYLPLGKLDYQITVGEYAEISKPFFRLYGNSYAQPPPEPAPEEPSKEAVKDKMEVEQNADFEPNGDFA
jgi:hypothetical protein